jgi:hypothetical protein
MDVLSPFKRYLTAWQTFRVDALRDWRDSVISATAAAIDEEPRDAKLPKVSAREVPEKITMLGNFRRDARFLREQARADDAQNIIDTGRKVDATNQEQVNALTKDRADLDRHYSTLVAQRVLRGGSAAIGNSGGRGETGLPGISDASGRADGAAETDELPATCPAPEGWQLADRYEASIYATQLDRLISANEALGRIDPNGAPQK